MGEKRLDYVTPLPCEKRIDPGGAAKESFITLDKVFSIVISGQRSSLLESCPLVNKKHPPILLASTTDSTFLNLYLLTAS